MPTYPKKNLVMLPETYIFFWLKQCYIQIDFD